MNQSIRFRFTGTIPMLMHSGSLANPRDQYARAMKEITKKRNKTDADLDELVRLEFLGGCWVDEEDRLMVPAEAVEGSLINAAKKSKQGKTFKSAMIAEEAFCPLHFKDMNMNIHALWATQEYVDIRGARVGTSRIMRTRPIIPDWSIEVTIRYDENMISRADMIATAELAGQISGLGDYRPRFGRFTVEVI